jgi:hypothetical protein
MPNNECSDYEVGYGKPPRHARFKPGESGNPRGRPRGSKNVFVLLDEELNQTVTINENGRRRRITKRAAVVKHMVNKTLSGDPRVLQILLSQLRSREAHAEADPSSADMQEGDYEVIRHLEERLKKMVKEGSDK